MNSRENIDAYLEHHGIKGQRWGVRRFRNEDGSLTSAGRQRYDIGEPNQSANTNVSREKVKRKAFDVAKRLSGADMESLLRSDYRSIGRSQAQRGLKAMGISLGTAAGITIVSTSVPKLMSSFVRGPIYRFLKGTGSIVGKGMKKIGDDVISKLKNG